MGTDEHHVASAAHCWMAANRVGEGVNYMGKYKAKNLMLSSAAIKKELHGGGFGRIHVTRSKDSQRQ